MKLDIEKSKKNIYVKNLELLESKLKKIETSNGILTLVGISCDLGILIGLYNTISSMSNTDLTVTTAVINGAVMALGCIGFECSVNKIDDNNDKKRKLETKRKHIIKIMEQDGILDIENSDKNKLLVIKK